MKYLNHKSLVLCGIICILLLCCIICILMRVDRTAGPKNTIVEGWRPREDLQRLQAENREDREQARLSLNQNHKELIRDLIKLLGQPETGISSYYNWHSPKHLAVFMLGDLRSVDAVSILVKEIEYYNPRERAGSFLGEEERYPAAEALGKIGMPSIGPTIEKLKSYEKDGVGRRLCCWVINDVLGQKLGRIRLEMAIEEAKDSAAKKNLTAALAYFKTDEEKAAEERARRKKATG